jgi:hypothetical protein
VSGCAATGAGQVVGLTGGVFQNALLTRLAVAALRWWCGCWRAGVATIGKFYGIGAVVPVDFKNLAEAARLQINAWTAVDLSSGGSSISHPSPWSPSLHRRYPAPDLPANLACNTLNECPQC